MKPKVDLNPAMIPTTAAALLGAEFLKCYMEILLDAKRMGYPDAKVIGPVVLKGTDWTEEALERRIEQLRLAIEAAPTTFPSPFKDRIPEGDNRPWRPSLSPVSPGSPP